MQVTLAFSGGTPTASTRKTAALRTIDWGERGNLLYGLFLHSIEEDIFSSSKNRRTMENQVANKKKPEETDS